MNTGTAADNGTSTPNAGNANPDGAAPAVAAPPASAPAPAAATPAAPGTDGTPNPDGKAPEAQAPNVPESYEFQMPEGVQLDEAAATEFSAIAKELKLDQATAQKVADVGAKMAQRQAEAHANLVESWAASVKTDPEIGGDKMPENLATARKAMDAFGTPALKELLNSTGLGNNPEVIRAFFKAGKAISEDTFVAGRSPQGSQDTASKMYPSMKQN